ncbi:MAG: hypothetical protein ACR2PY_00130 [Salinispira sp.]
MISDNTTQHNTTQHNTTQVPFFQSDTYLHCCGAGTQRMPNTRTRSNCAGHNGCANP